MASNTCEINVGRLMEIRVSAGYHCVRDIERMIALMQSHFGKLAAGERCVIVADWRDVRMMSPETSVRAREMLSRANPRVIRSSILTLPERSLANLQVVRLVREADSDQRRHFTNAVEQHRWLSEVLTEPEQARLAEFLDMNAVVDGAADAEVAASPPAPSAPPALAARVSVRPGATGPQKQTGRAPRPR
jgi:hypothetical protein